MHARWQLRCRGATAGCLGARACIMKYPPQVTGQTLIMCTTLVHTSKECKPPGTASKAYLIAGACARNGHRC